MTVRTVTAGVIQVEVSAHEWTDGSVPDGFEQALREGPTEEWP